MSFVISIWQIYGDPALTFVCLLAFLIGVYFAIIPHEVAHGLVAKWNGDLTAKVNGRLTMNPVAHFDILGFIMLITVGFGFAKPVPVNPYNFKVPRRGLFTVAIAGVTYNIAAAIVSSFLFAIYLTISQAVAINIYLDFFLYYTLIFLMLINWALFFFNILPLGPLDGFKIIEAYASPTNKFIGFLRTYGTYILIGLFALSLISSYAYSATQIEWLQYFDILGLYINFFRHYVGGGILSLFTMMFGHGAIGFNIL